jgi:hypothetical protein
VSGTVSDHRLGPGHPRPSDPAASDEACTLHVHAVFRDLDAEHVQTLAAEMIARAHELANRPEYQCDVDVDVQCAAPEARR